MSRKPPIAILTIILSALMLLAAIAGMFNAIQAWQLTSRGELSVLKYLWILASAAGTLLLCASTLYAGFRRPSWGYVMTILFGIYLAVLTTISVVKPNPHPVFQIHPGAEEAGAYVGKVLMIGLMVLYVGFLVFGRNARDYYRQTEDRAGA